MRLRENSNAPVAPGVLRAVLAVTCAAQLLLGGWFYFAPQFAFALLGRPVLDPVISRQYGLFLVSVALLYGVIASDPLRFRRAIWIGVAQRLAELAIAIVDWRAGELVTSAFSRLAVCELVVAVAFTGCVLGTSPATGRRDVPLRANRWLVRTLVGFGALQLFWTVCSTIFVQLGSRLLGWKLQDAYTTQQQGIALLVIGLTSLLAATDVPRYRRLIWIPLSSQGLGIINAVNELRLGTITLTIALLQWAIQASIIAALIRFGSAGEPEPDRIGPAVMPLA